MEAIKIDVTVPVELRMTIFCFVYDIFVIPPIAVVVRISQLMTARHRAHF